MTPSEQLVERARELVPTLAEQAPATRSARRVSAESIERLHDAGFFKILQPERWGGLELPPRVFFEVQAILAEGCASTAWVFGVVAVHGWQLALFDDQAQEDVWGEDPRALISSSYAPTGNAEPAEGGFRLSGRWSFSSGCDNCDWVFLGCFAPEMRTFLLPKADYRIEDNWNVVGLEGTGSKDIIVEDAFVPMHRTHLLLDGFKGSSPGNTVNTGPLYRIPFGQIFVRSVSTTIVGVAQAALDTFIRTAKERIGASDSARVALDPTARRVAAEATSIIDETRLVLLRNVDELWESAQRGEMLPIERRAQFRFESAKAVRKCSQAVEMLFGASGGRAMFTDSPMQCLFQDAMAAALHFANKTDKPALNLGGVLLGGKTEDYFL